jgi:dual oxidase
MTSWIDASFVYSTKEAWVNAMRTFNKGELKLTQSADPKLGMPPRNTDRIPLQNHPAPHVLRMLPPERMYRKSILGSHAHFYMKI